MRLTERFGAGRRLRRRCYEIAQDLDLRTPFDLDDVVDQVSARRGRRIRMLEMTRGPDLAVCGAWLAGESEDYVFVDGRAVGVHREHIVLHELAHMLCGHRSLLSSAPTPSAASSAAGSAAGSAADQAADHFAGLMPDLDPATVRRVLARSDYRDDQEREAELLASMLRGGRTHLPPSPLSSSARRELAAGRRAG